MLKKENKNSSIGTDGSFSALRLPVVANRLGVSRRFIEQQIAKGNLQCVRFSPRCIRITPAQLEDWIERRSV